VDAHRVEGDLVRRLRGVDLGHRQPHVVVRVRGGIVDEKAGRGDPRRHVGQHQLDGLVLGDGLAERHPLL